MRFYGVNMKINVKKVLDFWFADSVECRESYQKRNQLWFMSSESFDEEIRNHFESYLELAASSGGSQLEEQPKSTLALIIILDQFPRNIYRGTPQAFAYDNDALRLTLMAIDTGMYESLSFVERLFFFMPLQHAEDLEIQNLSVQMFQQLIHVADNPIHKDGAEDSLVYANLHKEIIEKFGRFPHRNEILDRPSTKAELEYLASGAETFGQSKKQ
jgi:uncharacterized protein (DUF924 family)